MRKLLLVIFIGMVLAIQIYGIAQTNTVEEVDCIEESTITVYME